MLIAKCILTEDKKIMFLILKSFLCEVVYIIIIQ